MVTTIAAAIVAVHQAATPIAIRMLTIRAATNQLSEGPFKALLFQLILLTSFNSFNNPSTDSK